MTAQGVKIQKQYGITTTTSTALLSKPINPIRLTAQQKKVLQTVLRGQNVFFTGSAGTGKSYLLRRIIGDCEGLF